MVFNRLTKVLILPLYYLLHHNFIIGIIQKFLLQRFHFFFEYKEHSIAKLFRFFFKTYEYNDRKLIEQNITKKNKLL